MTRRILIGLLIACCAPAADLPQRIVSLSPNVTEMLYGVGAFSRVVGVSEYCTYPPEVTKLPTVGGWATPDLERLAGLRPNLVIVDDAQGELFQERFKKLGLRVMSVKDHTIEESYGAMAALGKATDHDLDAAKLIAS